MDETKTPLMKGGEGTDLENPGAEQEQEPLRPMPVRFCHACLNASFLLFGKEYGWAGFCFLVLATLCSVTTSIYSTWLFGCMVMMAFFASTFCFSGYQAVSGRYELARPLMLAGMCMFLTCVLGGHFFHKWSKHAGSQLFDGVALADLPGATKGYEKNAVFFFQDGKVGVDSTGSFKLCKDKLPVVGTCVYDYFCVAPILGSGGKNDVHAWAGILSHVACDDSNFLTSEDRLQWGDDARAGLGIVRDVNWNAAVLDACKSFNITEVDGAPIVSWTGDPMKTERDAWNTAWLVECCVFAGYLAMVAVYSVTMGYSAEAYPTSRKIFDPNAKDLPSRRKLANPSV